ncbi:MAG: hypothetical protein IVW51_11065 [Thermaceae bacterium]|nr:hypothetical protein [Thermaceae bacterium]
MFAAEYKSNAKSPTPVTTLSAPLGTIVYPAGTLLLAFVLAQATTNPALNLPAGWASLGNWVSAGPTYTSWVGVYGKVWDPADVGGNLTITAPGAVLRIIHIQVISGGNYTSLPALTPVHDAVSQLAPNPNIYASPPLLAPVVVFTATASPNAALTFRTTLSETLGSAFFGGPGNYLVGNPALSGFDPSVTSINIMALSVADGGPGGAGGPADGFQFVAISLPSSPGPSGWDTRGARKGQLRRYPTGLGDSDNTKRS